MVLEALKDKELKYPAPLPFSFVVLVPLWLRLLAPLSGEQRMQLPRFHCSDSGVRSAVVYA